MMTAWTDTITQAIQLPYEALVMMHELANNPPRPTPRLLAAARRQRAYREGRNESYYIDLIAEWLRSIGVTVHMCAHDLPHYGGLYRSETREVFVNEPDARSALLVLAHEAGHHIGYLLAGHDRNERRPSLHRERQAYVYGWRVLRLLGADAIVSREQWIRACRESYEQFTKTAHKRAR